MKIWKKSKKQNCRHFQYYVPWQHNPPKNKTNKIHLRFYSNWEKLLWHAHKTRQMNELVFDSSIVCLLWGCPGPHCLANFGDINHSVQSRLAQNGVSFKNLSKLFILTWFLKRINWWLEKVNFLSEVSTEYTCFLLWKGHSTTNKAKGKKKSIILIKSHVIICHFIRRYLAPQLPYF